MLQYQQEINESEKATGGTVANQWVDVLDVLDESEISCGLCHVINEALIAMRSEHQTKSVGLNTFTGESGGSLVNANEPKRKCGTDADCDCECDPEPIQKAIAPLDELSGRLEGLWEKLEASGELEGLSDDVLALLKLVDESMVDEISKSKHEPIKKSSGCGANADGGGGFQPGNTCGGEGDSSGGGKGSSNDGMNSERSMVSKVSSWLAGTSNKDDLDHKMASSVDGSGDLKKSKVFKEAVKKATSKMSDSAAKEAMANIKEVDFFDSARDLTKKALELHPEMAEFVPEGSVIAGLYTEGGKMLLNGGAETGDAEGATHGTYLHELVHAMDKGDKVAHSDDWLIAWNREMRGGQLTEYGASSPVEGLAEFGRVLFDEGEEAVKQKYPRSLKIFKNKGWVK